MVLFVDSVQLFFLFKQSDIRSSLWFFSWGKGGLYFFRCNSQINLYIMMITGTREWRKDYSSEMGALCLKQ